MTKSRLFLLLGWRFLPKHPGIWQWPLVLFKNSSGTAISFRFSGGYLIRQKAIVVFLTIVGGCFLSACNHPAKTDSVPTNNPVETVSRSGKTDDPSSSANNHLKRSQIVALGDSLTAGYGLLPAQSYPSLLQQRIDELGLSYEVVNAGVSGDTSAGGLRRLDWAFAGEVKFVILELGANDGLRALPPIELKKNLRQIIEAAQQKQALVILAGMAAPPNYGPEYSREFQKVYADLAREYRLPLIPFFLDGVAGRPELNQADGVHPNEFGTKIVADNVWKTLSPLLQKKHP